MTAKSLFNIVLKVLGISFIKDIVISIPGLLSVIYSFGAGDVPSGFTMLLLTLFTLFVYFVVVYLLVFRTDWVMEKLQLVEAVPEDPIPLNIHRSTVVSISILIVALLIITQAIPQLIGQLMKWNQYTRFARTGYTNASFDYSYTLIYAAEIVIGLLLIGYHRPLVNYIELKTKQRMA